MYWQNSTNSIFPSTNTGNIPPYCLPVIAICVGRARAHTLLSKWYLKRTRQRERTRQWKLPGYKTAIGRNACAIEEPLSIINAGLGYSVAQ